MTNPKSINLYDWIHNAYEPFIYWGILMDMIRGRESSRGGTNPLTEVKLIQGFIQAAEIASPEQKLCIKSLIKYLIQSADPYDIIKELPFWYIPKAKK